MAKDTERTPSVVRPAFQGNPAEQVHCGGALLFMLPHEPVAWVYDAALSDYQTTKRIQTRENALEPC